ncbi:hypothetical protein [Streptomyces sp. KN37]|uniref:hypothetical protein n=1 Tax=Streptomyces sp. KN37 TaxID=3090667 RepID=UPI002A756ADA|nr:hypothetical protein [Streptomyces sp. KN37]WPO70232.1 hypothetical protein R9806_06110 [Streptomyces sp. KN37]WPO73998.1 hypothetical protein R9806_26955 [Streptomyces sp. KN37]
MAGLIQERRLDVFVDSYAFAFIESWDAELPVEFPDGFDTGVFVNAFPGRVDVCSAGNTHTAAVTVQVWGETPPAEDGSAWEAQGEAGFESLSGDVAVWTPALGRTDDLIELGGKGSWRIRVSCTGRTKVAALRESEDPVVGVERYLVQFFPGS